MQIPTQMGPKSLNVNKTAKDGLTRAAWYGFALKYLTYVENCFTCADLLDLGAKIWEGRHEDGFWI